MGKITIDLLKEEFKKREYTLLSTSYTYREKLSYICDKHPNEIQSIRCDSFRAGNGCKICANESRRKPVHLIEKEVVERGYEFFGVFYTKRRTFIKYKCPNHQDVIQEMLYDNFQKGCECAICTGHKKKTFEYVEKFFESQGYKLLSNKYLGPHRKLKYKCPKHSDKIQEITWNNFYYGGQRCPICKESRGERAIRTALEKNGVEFIEQKTFDDLRHKRKLSFDFFIPQKNILIEYQGEYHDGSVMKQNPNYQSPEDFKGQKYRDSLKKKYANKNSYALLEIWYWDFDNIERILSREGVI